MLCTVGPSSCADAKSGSPSTLSPARLSCVRNPKSALTKSTRNAQIRPSVHAGESGTQPVKNSGYTNSSWGRRAATRAPPTLSSRRRAVQTPRRSEASPKKGSISRPSVVLADTARALAHLLLHGQMQAQIKLQLLVVGLDVAAQLIKRLIVFLFLQVSELMRHHHAQERLREFCKHTGHAQFVFGLGATALSAGRVSVQTERVVQ